MIEWLSQDSYVPSEEYSICTEIRQWAFDLAMFEGNWNTQLPTLLQSFWYVHACVLPKRTVVYICKLFTSAAKQMI